MARNQILTGQARFISPGEMVLDPGPRQPISIDTRSAVATVESNPAAFARADLAGAKMGDAVAGIGNTLSELGLKQMEAINIRKQAEAQAMMSDAEAEMQARMIAEPDETKWEAIASEHAGKVQSQIGKLELSPVARAAVENDFIRWDSHRRGQVKIESAKESIRRARGLIGDRLKLAVEKQDYASLESNLAGAVKGGYLTEEAAEMTRLEAKAEGERQTKQRKVEARNTDVERLSASLLEDPWQTLEDLKSNSPDDETRSAAYPSLDSTDRLRAIADAQAQIRKTQADQISGEGGLRDRIVTGDVGDEQIADAGIALRLGAEEVEGLKEFRKKLAEQRAAGLPLDRKAVGALVAEIEAYDADETKDPSQSKWGELVQRAEILTAAGGKEGSLTRGVLMQKLYQRNPYVERRTDKDLPDGVEKEFNAYLSAYRADGAFGVPEYRSVQKQIPTKDGLVPDPAGAFVSEPNPAAAVRFIEAQHRLWEKLRSEYKAKPEKFQDPGALEKWIGSELKGIRAGAKVEALRAAPGPTLFPEGAAPPTLDELDSLLK